MNIAILGAGAWGTALAVKLALRHDVVLWTRDRALAESLDRTRINERYLPGVRLSDRIRIEWSLAQAAGHADCRIVATSTAGLMPVAEALPRDDVPLLWLCKGFVIRPPDVLLAHQAIAGLGIRRWGLLSGPSFAQEVAANAPTALVLAGCDIEFAEAWSTALRDETFRIYASDDVVGVETGGAVKNVMAIATGISDGLHLGNNARAALVTRGLAEIGRLAHALGGRRETLMGLSGLGDLVLTCTGDLSRNRQVGLQLAQGRSIDEIQRSLNHVAEGVMATKAVRVLATAHGVDMPICEAIDQVLERRISAGEAVRRLLQREPMRE